MKRFARIAVAGFLTLALPLAAQAQSSGAMGGAGKPEPATGDQMPRDQVTSGNSAQDQIDPNQNKAVKPRASINDPSVTPPGVVSDDAQPAPKDDSVGLPKGSSTRHSFGRRTRSTTRRAAPPSTLDTGSGNSIDSGNMNNSGDLDTGTMDNPGSNLNGVSPSQPNGTHGNANDQGTTDRDFNNRM